MKPFRIVALSLCVIAVLPHVFAQELVPESFVDAAVSPTSTPEQPIERRDKPARETSESVASDPPRSVPTSYPSSVDPQQTTTSRLSTNPSAVRTGKAKVGGTGPQLKIFKLKHIEATIAKQTISQLLRRYVASLAVDERSNSLIVGGDAQQLAAIEALLRLLDTESDEPLPATMRSIHALVRALRNTGFEEDQLDKLPGMSGVGDQFGNLPGMHGLDLDASRQSIETLRERSKYQEARTRQIALRLRIAKIGPDQSQESNELRESVRKSFEGRQLLQRAELAEFQERMRQIGQSIELRDRVADQIIERRVKDLLNPHRRWETIDITESEQDEPGVSVDGRGTLPRTPLNGY